MSDNTPQPQPKRWPSKRWIVLGGAGLAVVVVVLVIVVRPLLSPPPPPPPPLVTPGQLDSILLNAAQINTIMGAANMQASKPRLAPANPTSTLSSPGCRGALAAGQAPTYAFSGYTALRWVEAKEPGGKIDHYVAQAAAIFSNADKASAFVKTSAAQWKTCLGQTVTVTGTDGSKITWFLETLIGDPPKIAMSEIRQDVGDWTCQRAMRAVSNVVIDVTACGYHIIDQGSGITDRIAANMPK
ncbi:MAG: sensor domain-containing protein [Mycobacterium sp.]